MTYNGWTNWETWMINLHFDGSFDYLVDEASEILDLDSVEDKDDLEIQIANYIESYVVDAIDSLAETQNPLIGDLINGTLSEVDWREIASHYADDVWEALELMEDDD